MEEQENLHNFKIGDYVRLLNIGVTVQLMCDDHVYHARTTSDDGIRHARPDEIKRLKESESGISE